MTESNQQRAQNQVVVIGPDGQPIATMPMPSQQAGDSSGGGAAGDGGGDEATNLMEMVSEPAKVMRIGSMIKQLLDEVRAAPLDDASRNRLRQVHERSIHELEDGLSPELRDELHRLSLPFGDDTTPSDAELRIAQAQLVGWLEGLFHGIQTALFAQQMAARAQLEEMRRRALPGGSSMGMPGQPGMPGAGRGPGMPGEGREHPGGGQYL